MLNGWIYEGDGGDFIVSLKLKEQGKLLATPVLDTAARSLWAL